MTAPLQPAPQAAAYVIPAPPVASLPVQGTDARFPVHRIYCVGRNYAAHAVEMGHDPDREAPFFFLKSPTTLLTDGADFPYPVATEDVHHEVEMVAALSSGGCNIAVSDALNHVFGYGIGLDMTRRDLQAQAKAQGRPWELAKSFEHSAPCSPLLPAAQIGHPARGAIWLEVNGTRRQTGDLHQMIWKTAEVIAYLSGLFELRAGDLIMTGTPAGVGAVTRGDVMHAHVEGLGDLRCKVV
ncbi:fumarylacetoacetate hydrolase family protein [Roseicitreum antarcticum]|uniref:Fumarylpyruvate hydrolase n=1 Tax=Roseicitreum antarcticum TaxID=564137 RepID=A0A1H2U3H1_9RHOB|nr:fumarylacetoacetate hydrolase family protein [Roseicitreum antarcticum]SDW49964.1 fumarylpyruvate hydrolase [Roseicitreum antarcticum]